MMDLKTVIANNRIWAAKKLETDAGYFTNLAKSQDPKILYIGCADSRVTAEDMMGVQPGDAFVHRNIANMVPNTDLSAMSVINYSVSHLRVEDIIVCGHYGCGGVKAAMQPSDLGILNPWLREIRDVYRLHKKELDQITDEEAKYRRLVELNVQEQCINVIKTAEVQQAYKQRNLMVHGWVFDLGTGRLRDLEIDFSKIIGEIKEVYLLD